MASRGKPPRDASLTKLRAELRLLRSQIAICPERPGERVEFSALGQRLTLTYEKRLRAEAFAEVLEQRIKQAERQRGLQGSAR